MTRIALVTGSNRGIGFAICKGLAQGGLQVILTSRNSQLGQEATQQLQNEGLDVTYHQLDVADPDSVATIRDWVQQEFGRLDTLVNNAALFPDEGVSVFDVAPDLVRKTFEANTLGPLMLCQAFVPMMKQQGYGRVVNVSSGMGSLTEMGGKTASYRISKAGLNALTRILAAEVGGTNIKVNTMCPGWVRTRMGGASASLSPEQGADTAIWLATLPDDGPTNGFFRDRKPIAW